MISDAALREPNENLVRNLELASEGLLQQAIAGLLTRLPDVANVQILQGSLEFGKDIIFTITGGFGEKILCSCVVKNHRITGEADSSRGARTVLIQAEQSFDTPYPDSTGHEQRVQRVYIVTPAPLPPATILSIRGRLQERSGQVVFVGGAELFDLFKRYWPDFVADQLDTLNKHLRAVSGSIHEENPIRNLAQIYSLGEVEKRPDAVYVEQDFSRDLIRFRESSVVSAFLPNKRDFAGTWKRSQVDQFIRLLAALKRNLAVGREWGYVRQTPHISRILFPCIDAVTPLYHLHLCAELTSLKIQKRPLTPGC